MMREPLGAATGLADRVFDITDIVAHIEQAEAPQPTELGDSHSA
jgi:hypothetical protein